MKSSQIIDLQIQFISSSSNKYFQIIMNNIATFISMALQQISYLQNCIMVDRYRSMLGSQVSSSLIEPQLPPNPNDYQQTIRNAYVNSEKMRKLITDYKRATDVDGEEQIIAQFKRQQKYLRTNRDYLYQQYKSLQSNPNDAKFLFLKKQLIRTTQMQMNLEIELNEKITQKKQKLQKGTKYLQSHSPHSPQLVNALNDILQKRQEIIYLEESVSQCLQLFQEIKIITEHQSNQIDTIYDNVKNANLQIDAALVNIDKAKRRSKQCLNKTCCIAILAVVIIVLVVGIYLGFFVIN